MTRIAINTVDLTRVPPFIASMLLGDVTGNLVIVREVEKGRVDDGALVLECEECRARAIVEILWTKDVSENRYLTRAYQEGPRGGWKKL